MRRFLLPLVLGAAFVAASAEASPTHDRGPDRTPLSCDGKPADFHADRAKEIIKKAHDLLRVLDPTPVKRDEKTSWQTHVRCLRDPERRARMHQRVDRAAERFDQHFENLINPPGEGWLASTRYCESGSSGSYAEPGGDTYGGAYQFDRTAWGMTASTYKKLTGLKPAPDRVYPIAQPREQDIRAAILYRMVGPGAWPVCG